MKKGDARKPRICRNAKGELCRITLACLFGRVSNFNLKQCPPLVTCVNKSIANRFLIKRSDEQAGMSMKGQELNHGGGQGQNEGGPRVWADPIRTQIPKARVQLDVIPI